MKILNSWCDNPTIALIRKPLPHNLHCGEEPRFRECLLYSPQHLSPPWVGDHKHHCRLLDAIKQMAALNPNDVGHLPGGLCFHILPLFHNPQWSISCILKNMNERTDSGNRFTAISTPWPCCCFIHLRRSCLKIPRGQFRRSGILCICRDLPPTPHLSCLQVKQKNLILKRTGYEAWLLLISYATLVKLKLSEH